MKKIIISFIIAGIVAAGIFCGIQVYSLSQKEKEYPSKAQPLATKENMEISTITINAMDKEKTTPHTLCIYKTYYTQCMHFVQEYKDIEPSLVNCTKEEVEEKCKGWKIEKFSNEEIELIKEVEGFCNQHYCVKLEDNVIVIYQIHENGTETEYEQTGITTEYLTEEDILRLTTGIVIYGKENLTSAIEDFE